MEARLQRLGRNRCMQMIGGDDHQQLHALLGRECLFAGEHLLPFAVTAGRGQAQRIAGAPVVLGLTAEGTAHQFITPIQPRRLAVSLADEGAFAAANKAHSYFLHSNRHRKSSLYGQLPIMM